MIPADDSVRLIDQIVEEMDISPLIRAYSDTGQKSATISAFFMPAHGGPGETGNPLLRKRRSAYREPAADALLGEGRRHLRQRLF